MSHGAQKLSPSVKMCLRSGKACNFCVVTVGFQDSFHVADTGHPMPRLIFTPVQ